MLNVLTLIFFSILVFGQEFTESQRQFIKAENILKNPGGENGRTDWTLTAGLLASEATILVSGKRSLKVTLTAQALTLHQDSTLYQAQFADGVQGLALVRVKTSVAGIRVCSRQNAVVTSNLCVSVQANGKWGLYKVPFTLGGTSNGISINSNGTSVTGDVYVDDAFVGAVDLAATVDQSRIAGESYFAGTTLCLWSRTSASLGAFTSVAACPGPTVNYSSMGQWQTTDSDLPRQTINNLPAGVYKVTFNAPTYSTVGSGNLVTIYDGNSTCASVGVSSNTQSGQAIISCVFVYTSSGNRNFELYGSSSGSTINIENNLINRNTKFTLEYYGSGTTYSSTNADTDWASCGHTTSDFTNFGTVSNINLKCKREGSDLLMRGSVTCGVTAGAEARINLKLGGTTLTSSSNISTLEGTGSVGNSTAATGRITQTLIEPSVTYMTIGWSDASAGGNLYSKANANAICTNGTTISVVGRFPINGWQNSNIIIGQFNGLESCTNTLECTDVFSAKVSSAGVVSDENVSSFINGNATLVTSVYTINFGSDIFTVAPNCSLGASNGNTVIPRINSISSTQVVIAEFGSTTGNPNDGSFHIICQKQGVDYIGKTAKAVASDQNLRTPSVTNAVFISAEISSAGVVSQEDSDFINGSCTVTDTSLYTCTWNTSYWASAPKCMPNVTNGSQNFKADKEVIPTTASGIFRTASSTTGAKAASGFTLFCHGVKL